MVQSHYYIDPDAFEPSLLPVLSFGKLSVWSSVLCYEDTEEQVIYEADWKVLQILVEIVWKVRNMSIFFFL